MHGMEHVASRRFINPLLDSIVAARGGTGAPTGADSAALRGALQGIVDQMMHGEAGPGGARPGPTQCHDITVYSDIGLAGGACAGYGFLLDISDVAHPRRIAAVADSNFSFWHSATFNNDGSKILFSDEWGGGLQPRCRPTDKPEWGANAIFTRSRDTMTFRSYYKLPVPQSAEENCVAHNGSLIPVPGRDIMVQGWYQGGISVFDWTDAAHPREIAYFDRGPMDSTKLVGAGSWSAYWYNGYIVSSEIARGLDILELQPSRFAVAERDRRGAAGAFRLPERPGPAQARLARELRGGARLSGPARPLERVGVHQGDGSAGRARSRRTGRGSGAPRRRCNSSPRSSAPMRPGRPIRPRCGCSRRRWRTWRLR